MRVSTLTPESTCDATSTWIGFQEGIGAIPGFDLYNLLVDVPGHPAHSTVTAKTLEAAGLEVPFRTVRP